MTSAILIEKYRLDRRAIQRVIEDECNLRVIAEAENISEALAMSRSYCPEWLFVTPGHDPMGALDNIMRIHNNCEKIRIVVLANQGFASFVQRAFKLGVRACISKGCRIDDMKTAIRQVQDGKQFMSQEYVEYIINGNEDKKAMRNINRLTNRELQIMLMFVENMNVEQIASRLFLSPKTVRTYRYRIFDKLGVRSDVALMHMANDNGLLEHISVVNCAA